jgi:imidazolonepropionase-like amidohydrolase
MVAMKAQTFVKFTCLAAGVLAPLAAQDLTIVNARIIGPNSAVIERGSIVVRAGKIVSVAPGASRVQAAQPSTPRA